MLTPHYVRMQIRKTFYQYMNLIKTSRLTCNLILIFFDCTGFEWSFDVGVVKSGMIEAGAHPAKQYDRSGWNASACASKQEDCAMITSITIILTALIRMLAIAAKSEMVLWDFSYTVVLVFFIVSRLFSISCRKTVHRCTIENWIHRDNMGQTR